MRLAITLDVDTAAAVEQVRRDRGLNISDAVNHLIRLAAAEPRPGFTQRTSAGHARIDVTDTAETLERLAGPWAR